MLESWDLKIRIPRRKLRIWSYSQVETRQYRSKYLNIYLLIVFFSYPVFFNWFIGLKQYMFDKCTVLRKEIKNTTLLSIRIRFIVKPMLFLTIPVARWPGL